MRPQPHDQVAVIGAGRVGRAVTSLLLDRDVDVTVLDPDLATAGSLLDLGHAARAARYGGAGGSRLFWNEPERFSSARVVVHTAGASVEPGASRLSVLQASLAITRSVFGELELGPGASVVCVSNPVDVVTREVWRLTRSRPARVVGTGTMLESIRLEHHLAEAAGCDPRDVHAEVFGEHGETQVPILSRSTIDGSPVVEVLDAAAIAGAIEQTRNAARTIKETASATSWAVAACAVRITDALLGRGDLLAPVTVRVPPRLAQDRHLADVFFGLPCRIDPSGATVVEDIELDDEEWAVLRRSSRHVAAHLPLSS